MKNIIYFGYDLFADCLEYLISNPDINILKIYSCPSDGVFDFYDRVKQIAEKNNIPFTIQKIDAKELEFQFEQNGCDLAFSAGYAYRIPVEAVPSFRGVNLHPALLPQGRGPWPFPCIILKELDKSGVTAHKIAEKFDTGEILLQASFAVPDNESYRELEKKSQSAALSVTKKLMSDFENYWSASKPQGKGEYWKEPSDLERTVFRDTPEDLRDRIIRAFTKEYVIFSDEEKNKGDKLCY